MILAVKVSEIHGIDDQLVSFIVRVTGYTPTSPGLIEFRVKVVPVIERKV